MDALPIPEESGEPFACPTGTEAHACGHDFHTAMLLTAAKMLNENASMLSGRVRFMFQPAEETFEGAKDRLANGILEHVDGAPAHNPKVRFNEDVCPIGSACLAHCAVRWLEEHQA